MWLKQLTLVLLTVAVMVVSGEQYVILGEEPRKVDVPFGSSLTLGCHLGKYICNKTVDRFHLDWSFIPSGSTVNDSINISSSVEVNSTAKWLDLSNVTQNESGLYFCKVIGEIPCHEDMKSKGTQIVILPANPAYPEEPQVIHWWMWIVLGVSTFILMVLLVICVMLRSGSRRRRGTRSSDYHIDLS